MAWGRRVLSRLPRSVQFELKKLRYRRQIKKGGFVPPDSEIAALASMLKLGDWAIDVGANIGHYTCRLATCVGPSGRVLAFEPICETFELLAGNIRVAGLGNVTLINAAASSVCSVLSMDVPLYDKSGLRNFYQAHLVPGGPLQVLCLPLDALILPVRVRLIKVDAEGHDLEVLYGAESIIARDRPTLIIESAESGPIPDWLRQREYVFQRYPGSANIVAQPRMATWRSSPR
jgi:FkbM family methyltransferase